MLSVKEFCLATGLSRRTVFNRINDGSIRSANVGRRRLIPKSEIERLAQGAQHVPWLSDPAELMLAVERRGEVAVVRRSPGVHRQDGARRPAHGATAR